MAKKKRYFKWCGFHTVPWVRCRRNKRWCCYPIKVPEKISNEWIIKQNREGYNIREEELEECEK